MLTRITAFFVLLAVAHPLCCCLAASEASPAEAHACCQTNDATAPAQPEPGDCECQSEYEPQGLNAPDSWNPVPVLKLLLEADWPVASKSVPDEGPVVSLMASPSARPGREICQVNCVSRT